MNTVVSILPQQTFVKAIGGDKVNVSLMVRPGNSPHTYEPKPSQMIEIAKADLYFAIDVEFEHVWLPKFKNLNPKTGIIPSPTKRELIRTIETVIGICLIYCPITPDIRSIGKKAKTVVRVPTIKGHLNSKTVEIADSLELIP